MKATRLICKSGVAVVFMACCLAGGLHTDHWDSSITLCGLGLIAIRLFW